MNNFKDRADIILQYLLTHCMFPAKKVRSEELYKIFSQQKQLEDVKLIDFRRQLADLRDEFNAGQYVKCFKSNKPFTLIITTNEGYGSINSSQTNGEAQLAFYEARDFYYSRAKLIVQNTKRLDEMGNFLFRNEPKFI